LANKKVSIITLGCSKNTVESESVAGLFLKEGFELTGDISKSSIIVIHTCSFIKDAQLESEKQIEFACSLKKKSPGLKVFVSGCLPQLLKDEFIKKYPFTDGYVGTGNFGEIVKLIKKDSFFHDTSVAGGMNDPRKRVLSANLPTTYIKISEGCNHKCSFCIIPSLRGSYVSRTVKSITEEAKALAGCGIKEVNIIAQDTTNYGIDVYGRPALDRLLKELSKIRDLKWIRLLYAYPSTINRKLLDVINENSNICKYIDMPVQHISRSVLKNMARPLNTGAVVENIKKIYPEIILRTSVITGFPGETKNDFKELAGFIKQNYFEHVGIFAYSDQERAKSFKLKEKIKHETAEERKQILASLQFENVLKNNKARKGKVFEILIDEINSGKAYGRSWFQAPEIDSKFIVDIKNKSFRPGEFKEVIVSDVKDYDIIGQSVKK